MPVTPRTVKIAYVTDRDFLRPTTMGRLLIPRVISGYVLYVDGDTLVTGDVGRLFAIELGAAYAGVVRDYHVSHWLADPKTRSAECDPRLSEIRQFMMPAAAEDYFNAGVLLLNCDALKAQPELLSRIEDVAAASACIHGDQDHLNALFRSNVVQLDLTWNTSWGPVRRHRSLLARECLKLCVSDLAHAVFRYGQASKRPANIMAS